MSLLRMHLLRCTKTRTYSTSSLTPPTFSHPRSAKFLASAATPPSIPKLDGLPEVIVTGRANSGKSTLLNAVTGRRDMLHASSKAGRTKTLNFLQVGPQPDQPHLVLVDAPGYGARGRPEWGDVFDYYLMNRKQLRRVYILFNAKHPLNTYDHQMLSHLSSLLFSPEGTQRWTLQAVITKADAIVTGNKSHRKHTASVSKNATTLKGPKVLSRTGEKPKTEPKAKEEGQGEGIIKSMMNEIWTHAPLCLPPIVTSAIMNPPFGMEDVRRSVVDACGIRR